MPPLRLRFPPPALPKPHLKTRPIDGAFVNPIYLALDLPRLDAALALAQKVKGHVGGLKLGLEFFCAHGHHGVHELAHVGMPIFLDLKLHDIPNTVASAMQAIHVLEPAIVTIHAAGGRAMMEDAKAAAGERTKVVAVTVLTSLDDGDLAATGVGSSPHDQVLRLADLAQEAGLDGIVCSGHEVGEVHKRWKQGFFVVPGLRPAGDSVADQKRIVTPRQARDGGASVLVIGRPISRAEDPVAAARAIEATL
jgi:orotidine-5'-phosphate decarboxylase